MAILDKVAAAVTPGEREEQGADGRAGQAQGPLPAHFSRSMGD
jgi:hypothetical protein